MTRTPQAVKIAAVTPVVAGIYICLAKLGLTIGTFGTNATLIWPCSGIALSLVIAFGWRAVAGVFLGAATANLLFFTETFGVYRPTELIVAIVIGLGNASEAAGLWLLGNIFKKRGCRLYEPGIFPWWTLIRFGVCTICAYVGTSIQVCLGVMASAIWPFAYISWIIGDFLSLMILAPPTNTLLASLRRQTICWQVWKHVWEQDRNPQ